MVPPYYVGKGSGRRAFVKRTHRFPPPPIGRIVLQEFETEEDVFFAEKFMIAAYGREDLSEGCLLNLTDGGENPPSGKGKKRPTRTEEWRRKQSEAQKGKKLSEECKRRISEAQKGRVLSEPHKNKLSEIRMGMKFSEETKAKLSKTHKGKPWSKARREAQERKQNGRQSAIRRTPSGSSRRGTITAC